MKSNDTKLISEIIKKFKCEENYFEPYIRSIRFPRYKMLENDTKITFDFPLTVLIGENGCNKTSVLQALYGAPANKSVGEYWFETNVDKIQGKRKNCLIYEYKQKKLEKNVEALKTRVSKPGNPDYWEPSRPIKGYGMEVPTKEELERAENNSETRWDQLEKNVVYCDCKEYVSAYDLFFYHYNFSKGKKYKTRQAFIRTRSKYLAEAIKSGTKNLEYYKKNQIMSNEKMSEEVCETVSKIMGESYSEIRIVTHTLYSNGNTNKPSKTIWMKKNDMAYSEAFAGTGESRIILIVNDILNAKKNSLILIDEPEISLHPKAIVNLKNFLLERILTHGDQIILTTHSPQFIKNLPSKSIKFMMEKDDGTINVSNNTDYGEAFFELQEEVNNPIKIYVEDKLSRLVVKKVIQGMGKYCQEKVSVDIIPGGATNIVQNYVTSSACTKKNQDYYILDGDQNPFENISDEYADLIDKRNKKFCFNNVKKKDDTVEGYGEIIKELVGFKLNLHPSSNDKMGLIELQRRFLNFYMSHVHFFKCLTPELGIIEALGEKVDKDDKNGKEFFKNKALKLFGDDSVSSDDIFNCERTKLAKLTENNSLFEETKKIISGILNSSGRSQD
ncbi:AAA family ATPase [Liquorilactobacillus satsumensis]|uniref:AAA family ATPase n=1 Tax=Liquorilactobacillus satsumensis TaxID=259059 RepID=UPI0039EA8F1D